jgi:hypothetical protein
MLQRTAFLDNAQRCQGMAEAVCDSQSRACLAATAKSWRELALFEDLYTVVSGAALVAERTGS